MELINEQKSEDELINKLINFIFEKHKIRLSADDPVFMTVLLNKEVLKSFLNQINTELRKLPNALESVYIDSIKTLDRDFVNKIHLITDAWNDGISNNIPLLKTEIIKLFSENIEVKNSLLNLIEESKKSYKKEIDEYTEMYKTDLIELKKITMEINGIVSKNGLITPGKKKESIYKLLVFTFFFLLIFSVAFNFFTYNKLNNRYLDLVRVISNASDKFENNEAIKYIIKKSGES